MGRRRGYLEKRGHLCACRRTEESAPCFGCAQAGAGCCRTAQRMQLTRVSWVGRDHDGIGCTVEVDEAASASRQGRGPGMQAAGGTHARGSRASCSAGPRWCCNLTGNVRHICACRQGRQQRGMGVEALREQRASGRRGCHACGAYSCRAWPLIFTEAICRLMWASAGLAKSRNSPGSTGSAGRAGSADTKVAQGLASLSGRWPLLSNAAQRLPCMQQQQQHSRTGDTVLPCPMQAATWQKQWVGMHSHQEES